MAKKITFYQIIFV